MQEEFYGAFRALRPTIIERWETLLRIEPVNTPLANPDALVYLLGGTVDEIFEALRPDADSISASSRVRAELDCPCGRNPYVAFFLAGRQALLEALVLLQSESNHLVARERDTAVTEVCEAINSLTRREIVVFCSLCQYRVGESKSHLYSVSEQFH